MKALDDLVIAHSERVQCCIPFCERTEPREKPGSCEVICGTHWRLAPRRWRDVFRAAQRAIERGDNPTKNRTRQVWAWEKIKARIIERAASA